MATRKTWRWAGMVAIGAAFVVLAALGVIFQDSIVRFFATPRAPFQTVAAPPAPDYTDPAAWLAWPALAGDRPIDVFYIHSTTFFRRKLWNAPIGDPASDKIRKMVALPNEAGPFMSIGDIYAPQFREATLYSLFTHKFDGLAARRLAYEDVNRAFRVFLATRDPERPLAIVGYGQGGLYALGLLNEYFQGEINPLRRRLVAAYVIGISTPGEFLKQLKPAIPACEGPDETRCVISYVDFEPRFDEEMDRARERALMFSPSGEIVSLKSEGAVCVNPLSWRTDSAYQPPAGNLGAASATGIGDGDAPPAITGAVGARCENGILIVDTPKRRMLRRGDWFGAKWKPQPFNLFYYDLAENAKARTGALAIRLQAEPEPLAPIGETVDVGDSPINKAPH